MTGPKRVLVVGPAWVGDMIMAQSLFRILRRQHPEIEIDVLAPAWSAPLLARMPEVREAVQMPLGHGELGLRTRYRLGRELARRDYHQALILPRSFKSALIPWFARVPRRTGYLGERRYGVINDRRPLDPAAMPLVVQRYAGLGRESGACAPPLDELPWPALTVDAVNGLRVMGELGLSANRPTVALMPGAEYGPAKQWPLEYYAALARRLAEKGVQTWVLGSQKDFELGESIVSQSRLGLNAGSVNLCGKTQLHDAIDLLARVQVAVTNDSGLMHVAAAVGVPLVTLYGSSTPAYTPPLSARATIIYLNVACSPCFDRTCRFGHYNCLRDIAVVDVFNATCRQLALSASPVP